MLLRARLFIPIFLEGCFKFLGWGSSRGWLSDTWAEKEHRSITLCSVTKKKGNLPAIVSSFGRFFFQCFVHWQDLFVLVCWTCSLRMCSASFQRDLHAQVHFRSAEDLQKILRNPKLLPWKLLKEFSKLFQQNCFHGSSLGFRKIFRDLRSLFEKEVVWKVKEPLVWQFGNESDSFGLWILLIPQFWYRHIIHIDILLSSCSLQRYYYYVYCIHYLYTCIDSFIRIHPHAIWIRNIAWRHMNSERVHSVSFPWISFGCFSSAVAFSLSLSLTTFHAFDGQK